MKNKSADWPKHHCLWEPKSNCSSLSRTSSKFATICYFQDIGPPLSSAANAAVHTRLSDSGTFCSLIKGVHDPLEESVKTQSTLGGTLVKSNFEAVLLFDFFKPDLSFLLLDKDFFPFRPPEFSKACKKIYEHWKEKGQDLKRYEQQQTNKYPFEIAHIINVIWNFNFLYI